MCQSGCLEIEGVMELQCLLLFSYFMRFVDKWACLSQHIYGGMLNGVKESYLEQFSSD